MKKRICVTAASALLAALLLTAIGCSKGTSAKGAEFVFNNATEPQSLDPSQIEGVPEHRLYMALFEGLVSYDPKTSLPIPGVAESWSRSDSQDVITFKLRDCTWSDGVKITAQTFVDSWLYYLSPETAAKYAYMPAQVIKGAEDYNAGKAGKEAVGIRAVDEKTFEVTLTGPIPYAVDMMAHYSFAPLPLHAIQKNGKDWIKPKNFVGNGPFVLESWIPQDKITLVPNAKYWNKDNVFISRLTMLPIENEITSYQKYKSGELDWDPVVPLEMMDEVKLRDDYQVAPQLSSYYYFLNLNNPVLKDVRVRKALAMAFDRKELVEKVRRGGEVPATALTPPMAGYTPPKGSAYNPDEAKKLLADAGYPGGKDFPKMTIIYNTQEAHKKIAEFVQQQWKTNLNIDVELANLEWATFIEKRQANDFEIARAGWVGDYQDPSNFLEMFLTGGGNNDGRYENPEYDAMLKKATTMPSGAERMKLLVQAEEMLIGRDQAIIPFYYYVSNNMIDLSKWDGWFVNTMDIHPWVGLKKK